MSIRLGTNDIALATTREKLRGGIVKTKVGRYWPGKAPVWSSKIEEDHDDDDDFKMHNMVHVSKVVDIKDDDDPRLHRLAMSKVENCGEHVRVRHEAEVIVSSAQEDEEEEDIEERRRRIREKNLERAKEEEALLPEEEEEEEEESEWETDSDSEYEMFGVTMIKPSFVPKGERDTVTERERIEAKEEALKELEKRKLESRKIETKLIVVEEVKKDEETLKNKLIEEADVGDVETDDEIDEAKEYEVWNTREIARNKRRREVIEKEETEQERTTNPKPKRKFLQRYYHKGAFFQEDDILNRDFSAPTGEDRMDKTKQWKVAQVKNFGRSGRTKWTHLRNEDTTYVGKKDKKMTIEAM